MAQILFGFGGCIISDGVNIATFTGGEGTIEYIPYQKRVRAVNGNWINKLKGYDVKITCNKLYNIDSDDYVQYQKLARALSGNFVGTNQTLTITPRNDSTITDSLSYECYLDSSFKPEDVHRVKTGQVSGLTFMCSTLKNGIPTLISDTTEQDYWNGTDLYVDDGADQYIDDLG